MEDLKEYLSGLDIDALEKSKIYRFFSLQDYMNSLNQYGIQHKTKYTLSMGKGNVNSEIMIIINTIENELIVRQFLENILSKLNISLWNCYVTYQIKDLPENKLNEEILEKEISCIKPKVIITCGDSTNLKSNSNDLPIKFYISIEDIKYLSNEENKDESKFKQLYSELFKCLISIIPYKIIEHKE